MPLLQRFGGFELRDEGLVMHRGASFADAERVGCWLARMDQGLQRLCGLWFNAVKMKYPETYSQLFDPELFDPETWERYGRVVRNVPDWHPSVSFSAHQAVEGLDRKAQRQILRKARDERLTLAQVRQEARRASRRTIAAGAPAGRFRVAYLDPDYGPDTIRELATSPLGQHLLPSAAIFLWCPESHRDAAPELYEPWDCRRVGTFIWHTQQHEAASAYLSIRHWFLLWLVRGRCPPDRLVPMIESVVSVKASEPDRKPERFREIIDRLYDGPKAEWYWKGTSQAKEDWTFVGHLDTKVVA